MSFPFQKLVVVLVLTVMLAIPYRLLQLLSAWNGPWSDESALALLVPVMVVFAVLLRKHARSHRLVCLAIYAVLALALLYGQIDRKYGFVMHGIEHTASPFLWFSGFWLVTAAFAWWKGGERGLQEERSTNSSVNLDS